MPQDMFLKIDGIPGESQDKTHKDEIQILSYSFGAQQSGSAGIGGGSGVGKVHIQDFQFTKFIDKSSPKLFEACATGLHDKSAVFTCRKAGGTQQEYLKFTLSGAMVSSVSNATSGDETLPLETFSLNFNKIEIEYHPQDAKGGLGGAVHGGWDLVKNQKLA